MKLALLLTVLFSFISCGEDDPQTSNSQTFSYQFTEEGCDTKKQEFSAKEDMCKALTEGKRNNFCAVYSRMDYYSTQGCGTNLEFINFVSENDNLQDLNDCKVYRQDYANIAGMKDYIAARLAFKNAKTIKESEITKEELLKRALDYANGLQAFLQKYPYDLACIEEGTTDNPMNIIVVNTAETRQGIRDRIKALKNLDPDNFSEESLDL